LKLRHEQQTDPHKNINDKCKNNPNLWHNNIVIYEYKFRNL
jgi:hypothetical protein